MEKRFYRFTDEDDSEFYVVAHSIQEAEKVLAKKIPMDWDMPMDSPGPEEDEPDFTWIDLVREFQADEIYVFDSDPDLRGKEISYEFYQGEWVAYSVKLGYVVFAD